MHCSKQTAEWRQRTSGGSVIWLMPCTRTLLSCTLAHLNLIHPLICCNSDHVCVLEFSGVLLFFLLLANFQDQQTSKTRKLSGYWGREDFMEVDSGATIMKIFRCNCRGLGNSERVRKVLRKILKIHRLANKLLLWIYIIPKVTNAFIDFCIVFDVACE